MVHDDAHLPIESRDDGGSPRSAATLAIAIGLLGTADSPRLQGIDVSHVRALAQIEDDLPPILVHRSTMQVIDGMHRLGAAQLNGRDTINVQFFEGDREE